MAAKRFSASIKDFGDGALERAIRILKSSAQEVVSLAQTPQPSVKQTGGSFEIGKIPVDDGFLINSLQTSLNGSLVGAGQASYLLTIDSLQFGDVVEYRWTAAYAARIEFGFVGADSLGRVYNQAGRYYVTTAAAKWVSIVEANARNIS